VCRLGLSAKLAEIPSPLSSSVLYSHEVPPRGFSQDLGVGVHPQRVARVQFS
jgi:hypothetical protein